MTEEKKFAKGFCFKKLFLVFVLGCIIGVLWEESYLFIKRYLLDYPDKSYRLHRGLIYGPFNPVYGLGTLVITGILCFKKRHWLTTFFLASLLGGVIEFSCSYFQELFFGTTSWDYSYMFFSIGGRTNLVYMLFFGLLGTLFCYFVYPLFSKLVEKLPIIVGNILFYSLLVFFIFDIFISFAAVYRQNMRAEGVESSNSFEVFLDEKYPDEFLNVIYVNAIRK